MATMNDKWMLRGVVAAALALALWIGWERVQPPERMGDVPYVSTRLPVLDAMLELAEVGPDDLLFDLGSGDGRIVIGAAQRYGARGRGIELDPLLVAESQRNAAAAGVSELVEFSAGDLFEVELREATVVTLYLLPTVNLALRSKLIAELRPGTRVVSQSFDMADWRPDAEVRIDVDPPTELYLWVVPAPAGGVWTGSAPASPTLRLIQTFQEVEGELSWRDETVPVTGTVAGRRLHLQTTRPLRGDPAPLRFDAALDGDEVTGRMGPFGGGAAGDRELSLRRRPASVDGVWEISAGGETFAPQWLLLIDRDGPLWTAARRTLDTIGHAETVTVLPGSPPPVPEAQQGRERRMTDFYVWGSSIYFVVGGGEGDAPRVMYRGLVDGDRIAGTVHNGGRMIPWVARRSPEPR